jgi:hypothetical protein
MTPSLPTRSSTQRRAGRSISRRFDHGTDVIAAQITVDAAVPVGERMRPSGMGRKAWKST